MKILPGDVFVERGEWGIKVTDVDDDTVYYRYENGYVSQMGAEGFKRWAHSDGVVRTVMGASGNTLPAAMSRLLV